MRDTAESSRPPVLGPQVIGKMGGHTHRWAALRQEEAPPDGILDVFFCQLCLDYRRVWVGRE